VGSWWACGDSPQQVRVGGGKGRKGAGRVVCLLAVCAEFKVHARAIEGLMGGVTEAMRDVGGGGAGER
jgi:hypothetical protein